MWPKCPDSYKILQAHEDQDRHPVSDLAEARRRGGGQQQGRGDPEGEGPAAAAGGAGGAGGGGGADQEHLRLAGGGQLCQVGARDDWGLGVMITVTR